MKKLLISISVIVMFFCASFSFTACSTNTNGMLIYTSFYPIYDFTCKIVGDKATVVNLVPAGMEPHDYEISANEMAKMYDADVIFANGLGLEVWFDEKETNLGLPQELANKIVLTATDSSFSLIKADNNTYDSHVWLNVMYAKKQMEIIKNKLCDIDPLNTNYYTNNYLSYAIMFDGLEEQIQNIFSEIENKNIVVSHKALGYFCEAYGINQIAIEGFNPNSEPSIQEITNMVNEICELVTNYNINTIFYEKLFSNEVAITIINEVYARTAVSLKLEVLSTLEGLTQKELLMKEDYLSIMAKNVIAIKNSLV